MMMMNCAIVMDKITLFVIGKQNIVHSHINIFGICSHNPVLLESHCYQYVIHFKLGKERKRVKKNIIITKSPNHHSKGMRQQR